VEFFTSYRLGALAHTPPRHTGAPGDWFCWSSEPPGLLWALAILAIREPVRRTTEAPQAVCLRLGCKRMACHRLGTRNPDLRLSSLSHHSWITPWAAWAPTLLTREFHMDRAQVGVELGILLTRRIRRRSVGRWLAGRPAPGSRGGWSRKLLVCLIAGAPDFCRFAASINAAQVTVVLLSVPAYFALSGHRHGLWIFPRFSDVVPNRSRGPGHVDQLFF